MTDHRDLIQRLRDRVFLAEDAEDEQERASFAREIVDLGRELAAANGGGLSSDESGFPPASRALRMAPRASSCARSIRTPRPIRRRR